MPVYELAPRLSFKGVGVFKRPSVVIGQETEGKDIMILLTHEDWLAGEYKEMLAEVHQPDKVRVCASDGCSYRAIREVIGPAINKDPQLKGRMRYLS